MARDFFQNENKRIISSRKFTIYNLKLINNNTNNSANNLR